MINGAHTILCSKKPEADRAFLREVLKLPNVGVYQPRHARPKAMSVRKR